MKQISVCLMFRLCKLVAMELLSVAQVGSSLSVLFASLVEVV